MIDLMNIIEYIHIYEFKKTIKSIKLDQKAVEINQNLAKKR